MGHQIIQDKATKLLRNTKALPSITREGRLNLSCKIGNNKAIRVARRKAIKEAHSLGTKVHHRIKHNLTTKAAHPKQHIIHTHKSHSHFGESLC
jgi:hypothetical protein